MLDMSWGEVMLIGGVALIVIGPKDLPKALRTVGQVTTKLRRMAGEFQMQFNEAIREAELDDVRKEVEGIRGTVRSASNFNPVQTIRDELKGAVEGRAKTGTEAGSDPVPPVTYGPEKPAADAPAAWSQPEPPAWEAGPSGSSHPEPSLAEASSAEPSLPEPSLAEPPPASRPRSLADATARLKAAREAAHGPAGAPRPAIEMPIPGSVDDPFGMPESPPVQAEAANNGAAAR